MASLAVLGATGSIGRQTLEVADRLGLHVTGLAAKQPGRDLTQIAKHYAESRVAVSGGDSHERAEFAAAIGEDRVDFGPEALVAMAAKPGQIVMNAIVGLAGLPATLSAVKSGNRLALANKESMVAAGSLVKRGLTEGGGELIPVDSEHSAIFQCLVGESGPARIVLTASGGPFRGRKSADLRGVTPAEALKHPNWNMGRRITVDSATLANKALEVLEAMALFELTADLIEVVIHPESVVHSMVVFEDGSIKAQLGPPDMRLPIAYALTYPERAGGILGAFELGGTSLHFEKPDLETFPALALGYQAGETGGTAPAIFNAADEVAVDAFLDGRLDFLGIAETIEQTLNAVDIGPLASLEQVLDADAAARRVAEGCISKRLR
jgi:1-deoxy-D-xylulose-5-phosphate reductoisomerase